MLVATKSKGKDFVCLVDICAEQIGCELHSVHKRLKGTGTYLMLCHL